METNEELNLAEILKNTPQGTELYSPLYGVTEFEGVTEHGAVRVSYRAGKDKKYTAYFNLPANGKLHPDGECLLFPERNQRDWSKFAAPRKGPEEDFPTGGYVVYKNEPDYPWQIGVYSGRGRIEGKDGTRYRYIANILDWFDKATILSKSLCLSAFFRSCDYKWLPEDEKNYALLYGE